MNKSKSVGFSVIIGSSSEGIKVARELRRGLRELYGNNFGLVKVWDQGSIFESGESYMESLERTLDEFDFAVLVFTSDDIIKTRGKEYTQARDNVLFELGLFIGALGRTRTFLFCTDDPNLKLPSDLAGISHFKFNRQCIDINDRQFSDACDRLGKLIIDRANSDFSNRHEYFLLFPSLREDPFYLQLLAGITSNPSDDKDMAFSVPKHDYSGPEYLDKLEHILSCQRQFAGGIIAPTLENIETSDLTQLIGQFDIPIVIVDINPYRTSSLPKNVSYVGIDNKIGGELVFEAMKRQFAGDLDSKHVLVLGNEDQKERYEGFMNSWTGKIPPIFQPCRFSRIESYELTNKQISRSDSVLDAIFGCSDEIALGATQAVSDRKTGAIVLGFDGTSAAKILIDLKISPLVNTVVHDSYAIGEKAIRLLKKMMAKEPITNQIETVPIKLYV